MGQSKHFVATKTIEVPIQSTDVFGYVRACNDPVTKASLVNVTLQSMSDQDFARLKSYFEEYANKHCLAQLEIIKVARDALKKLDANES